MEIARALARHQVLFIEGGSPLAGFQAPAHVERVFLPALGMDAEFRKLETGAGDLEGVMATRRRLLGECFQDFRPDVLMVELFPFGRKRFAFELLPVLEGIHREGLPTRVVCSLRDILVEKADAAAYEKRVLDLLNRYFHLLLIHADPAVVSLPETFGRFAEIAIPFFYTGFVGRTGVCGRQPDSGKMIVASNGGGRVGGELLAATMRASRALPDPALRLRVFPGPFMEEGTLAALKRLAAADERSSIESFSLDFMNELGRAHLSVSMAGYNTCMDILCAGIPALVYPFGQNREQLLRARKLEALGRVKVLEDLEVGALAAAMRAALDGGSAPIAAALDLQGAAKTARILENFCGLH
jgi:predicted glycosyltransferase